MHPEPQPIAETISLLLVEDTVSMARVYAEYLKRGPYRVTINTTGHDAITEIDRHQPPVVILDLRLPDMDGMEVLRHIKAHAHDCAVIVVTADGSLNRAVEAMRDGALDFLVKPFNAERLLTTVENVLERKRLHRAVERLAESSAKADVLAMRRVNKFASDRGIRPLSLIEREAIEQAVSVCDGNVVRAAKMLEVSPSTIYRKRVFWG